MSCQKCWKVFLSSAIYTLVLTIPKVVILFAPLNLFAASLYTIPYILSYPNIFQQLNPLNQLPLVLPCLLLQSWTIFLKAGTRPPTPTYLICILCFIKHWTRIQHVFLVSTSLLHWLHTRVLLTVIRKRIDYSSVSSSVLRWSWALSPIF